MFARHRIIHCRGISTSLTKMAASQAISSQSQVPKAQFAAAIPSTLNKSRLLPQVIAHRGYKAAWPENTIEAMQAAIEAGAHAIETDVHLSADGVVVLSHDPTLKRCYGIDKRINQCDWEYLSTLKTIRAPHLKMPRLLDVLQWLNKPGLEHIWILLDIKMDDNAEDLLRAIAETLADLPSYNPWTGKTVPWSERIVLGCWSATFMKAARRHLPSYSIVHISFSLHYTKHFLTIPGVGANMLQRRLIGPRGTQFLNKLQRLPKRGPLLVWTVNSPQWIEWCLSRSEFNGKGGIIDGVITDDPLQYLSVCKRWEEEQEGIVAKRSKPPLGQRVRLKLRTLLEFIWIEALCTLGFLVRGLWQGKLDYLKKGEIL